MNKVFYENQLEKFKRANKLRKEKMAKENGYKSIESYKKSLEDNIANASNVVVEDIKDEIEAKHEESALDMVIAFDTTGSMASWIASVRNHVQELIPRILETSTMTRIKVIAFGDYCDMQSKDVFGKAYQESKLTNDPEILIDFVKKAKNTSGGDGDEFYELVIKKIVEETEWREEAKKAVLLIADARPHYIGYSYQNKVVDNQIDWKEEALKAAEKGISFDTLRIGFHEWYEELSKITSGVCLNFSNKDKASEVIEGLSYSRSNPAAYFSATANVEASGDEELIGAYKQMGTLL